MGIHPPTSALQAEGSFLALFPYFCSFGDAFWLSGMLSLAPAPSPGLHLVSELTTKKIRGGKLI